MNVTYMHAYVLVGGDDNTYEELQLESDLEAVQTSEVLVTVFKTCVRQITYHHIGGNIGKELNLVVWRSRFEPPN